MPNIALVIVHRANVNIKFIANKANIKIILEIYQWMIGWLYADSPAPFLPLLLQGTSFLFLTFC